MRNRRKTIKQQLRMKGSELAIAVIGALLKAGKIPAPTKDRRCWEGSVGIRVEWRDGELYLSLIKPPKKSEEVIVSGDVLSEFFK